MLDRLNKWMHHANVRLALRTRHGLSKKQADELCSFFAPTIETLRKNDADSDWTADTLFQYLEDGTMEAVLDSSLKQLQTQQ